MVPAAAEQVVAQFQRDGQRPGADLVILRDRELHRDALPRRDDRRQLLEVGDGDAAQVRRPRRGDDDRRRGRRRRR
jgi:hypothetical protein